MRKIEPKNVILQLSFIQFTGDLSYTVLKNFVKIRDSLVARITVCRMVDRGSIPRRGAFSYHLLRKWFSGKIQRCHRWAPGSIPGLRISFCISYFPIDSLFI